MQYLMQSQKWQNDLCSIQGKPFNVTVIQVCALTSNAEEALLVEQLNSSMKTYKTF